MKKNIPNFIKILLLIMIISITLLAIFWIPHIYKYLESSIAIVKDNTFLKIIYYTLSYIIILIALIVFSISFKFTKAIKTDTIFSIEIANQLKLIAYLVLTDCILFSACVIALLIFKEFLLTPSLIFFCVIGYALCSMLFILSTYVKEAAILKEEVEYTL